jgi:hypothetical protein
VAIAIAKAITNNKKPMNGNEKRKFRNFLIGNILSG